MYKQTEGADAVKIASDVYNVIKIYDSGEIYYLTGGSEVISLMDCVNDDMKNVDASITMPDYPDYPNSPIRPSWFDYDTDAEYNAAYETYEDKYEKWKAECDHIDAEYSAAWNTYYAKQSRDILRKELENETLELFQYSLCFYNGTEEVVITDDSVSADAYDCTCADNAAVISYKVYNQSDPKKINLSAIETIDGVKNMVTFNSSFERYIEVNGTATAVEQEKEYRAAGRFYYLCVILDLFSRKVIVYKLSNKINTALAIETVNLAVAARGKSEGIIFHTDRGCQFTCTRFRRHLDNLNMIQSFSAKGHPYNNAVMECFFKYLKKEEVNRKTYASLDDLKLCLFKYINGFYNSVRPHSHNNGLSPNQAEISFQ